MKILRDYILKEFFHSFIMSIIVFTFVLLVGNVIQLADLVINKGVEILSVLQLFFFLIPWLLSFTLPIAALTAVVLTFGRFSGDGELTAIKASGIGLFRISLPLLVLGVLFSFIAFYLNDQISPNASFASRRVVKEIGMKNPAAMLEEGTFIRGFGNYVIFIYEIKGNKFRNIRIYQPQEGKTTRTIVAESGEIHNQPGTSVIDLKLFNGTSEEPSPTEPDNFYKLNFKTYNMTIDIAKFLKKDAINKKTREMTVQEITKEIESVKAQNMDPTPLYVEIYKKVNMSIASFVLILMGIPLGIKAQRSEKSIGFGISLLLFAVYWGTFLGGIAMSLRGAVPPILGVSLPNAAFFVFGLVLFIHTARR
ncbi:MAG: LptF/LptG family permease [Candidatus Omnitrophica bacterium]|nr:LptF/LptG family permease [Candidatus Omnitrophota bacterium]